MGSLSLDKAGIGSAVNDTTRELGGTLGVAIVGSVLTSIYVSKLADGPVFGSLTAEAQEVTRDSVAAVGSLTPQLGAQAGPFVTEVSDAFLAGLAVSCVVVAAAAAAVAGAGAGSMFALRFLPARAR